MTSTFFGSERIVAKVYDPEGDIEYLFSNLRLAHVFYGQALKYNTLEPVFFEMDI